MNLFAVVLSCHMVALDWYRAVDQTILKTTLSRRRSLGGHTMLQGQNGATWDMAELYGYYVLRCRMLHDQRYVVGLNRCHVAGPNESILVRLILPTVPRRDLTHRCEHY